MCDIKGNPSTTTQGTSTLSTVGTQQPSPQILPYYENYLSNATRLADQPFNPATTGNVSPLTGQQTTAINSAVTGGLSAGTFDPSQVQAIMSPFTQNVVGSTQDWFNNQNAIQGSGLLGQAIRSGNAFGGDRAGMAQAQLAGQQQLAQAPVIAGLYEKGYQSALDEYNKLKQLGMAGSEQAIRASTIVQQQAQREEDVRQQNEMMKTAYPFQQANWYGSILGGIGPLMGGVTTTDAAGTTSGSTTPPQPSTLVQALGLAGSTIGLGRELFSKRGGLVQKHQWGGSVGGSGGFGGTFGGNEYNDDQYGDEYGDEYYGDGGGNEGGQQPGKDEGEETNVGAQKISYYTGSGEREEIESPFGKPLEVKKWKKLPYGQGAPGTIGGVPPSFLGAAGGAGGASGGGAAAQDSGGSLLGTGLQIAGAVIGGLTAGPAGVAAGSTLGDLAGDVVGVRRGGLIHLANGGPTDEDDDGGGGGWDTEEEDDGDVSLGQTGGGGQRPQPSAWDAYASADGASAPSSNMFMQSFGSSIGKGPTVQSLPPGLPPGMGPVPRTVPGAAQGTPAEYQRKTGKWPPAPGLVQTEPPPNGGVGGGGYREPAYGARQIPGLQPTLDQRIANSKMINFFTAMGRSGAITPMEGLLAGFGGLQQGAQRQAAYDRQHKMITDKDGNLHVMRNGELMYTGLRTKVPGGRGGRGLGKGDLGADIPGTAAWARVQADARARAKAEGAGGGGGGVKASDFNAINKRAEYWEGKGLSPEEALYRARKEYMDATGRQINLGEKPEPTPPVPEKPKEPNLIGDWADYFKDKISAPGSKPRTQPAAPEPTVPQPKVPAAGGTPPGGATPPAGGGAGAQRQPFTPAVDPYSRMLAALKSGAVDQATLTRQAKAAVERNPNERPAVVEMLKRAGIDPDAALGAPALVPYSQ